MLVTIPPNAMLHNLCVAPKIIGHSISRGPLILHVGAPLQEYFDRYMTMIMYSVPFQLFYTPCNIQEACQVE